MANELQGKTIAFVVIPEGAKRIELVWEAVKTAGGEGKLLKADALDIEVYDDLCVKLEGRKLRNPRRVSTENATDYQGIVVPGVANAGTSQMDQDVASFLMEFVKAGALLLEELPWSTDVDSKIRPLK